VVEAKIKRVTVSGNNHFDTSNIRASVPALVEGSVPDLDRLSAALRVANENPAKNVSLQLAPGVGDEELVATVSVKDQKPWKVGVSWDNSGTQQTGDDRVGVSLQHANLWNRDHVLTLQYQTSPRDTSNVRVAAATYRVPLYALGDALDFYASSSDVDAGTIAAGPFNLAITGKGESYGARYSFKLKRQGETDHELVFGLDYKRFQNGIGFGGIDLGNEVVTHPLSAQYSRRSNRAGEEMALNLTLVRNIAGGDKGDQAAISKSRQDAEADYVLLRGALSYSRALPQDWQARLALSAQAADKPLIAGEQFGAGGATSVRGFNERELSNDRGFQGSAELYSPPLCGGFASQQCRLLAFFDWASLSRLKPLPGEIRHENISGAGIGLRWSLGTTANLQMDYGRVIDDGGLSKSGDWKLHARVGVFF
jgi:hemolysin activation/secretion protein